MSDLFAFSEGERQRYLADEAQANPFDFNKDLEPTTFEGLGSELYRAPTRGIVRGLHGLGQVSADIGAWLYEDPNYGEQVVKGARSDIDEWANQELKPLQVNPQDLGTGTHIIGGALQGIAEFFAGTPFGFAKEEALDFQKKGVEPGTALALGATSAAAFELGGNVNEILGVVGSKLGLPKLGESLGSRLAYSTAGNVALGATARQAQQALLAAAGRHDLATEFENTPGTVALDALLGVLFEGGNELGRLGRSGFRDSVQTLAQDTHLRKAPAVPTDLRSENLHVAANRKAQEDLILGRPVEVDAKTAEATFTPDPVREAEIAETGKELDAVARAHGVDELPEVQVIPKAETAFSAPRYQFDKPVYELGIKDLDAAIEAEHARIRDNETALFGEDGAKQYRRLQNKVNSRDDARSDAALKKIADLEARLSETQRNSLYGIGDTRLSLEALRDLRYAREGALGETADEIAQFAYRTAGDLPKPGTDPATWTKKQLEAAAAWHQAMQSAKEHGINLKEVNDTLLQRYGDQFKDAEDFGLMMDRFMKSGEAPAPKAEPPKALPSPDFEYEFEDGQKVSIAEAHERIARETAELDQLAKATQAVGECFLGALS